MKLRNIAMALSTCTAWDLHGNALNDLDYYLRHIFKYFRLKEIDRRKKNGNILQQHYIQNNVILLQSPSHLLSF